jgi:hypothetical protein
MPCNANTGVNGTPKTIASTSLGGVDQNQSFDSDNNSKFLFKEFVWYADSGANEGGARLIHDAHDMASGMAVILGMVEMSNISDDCTDTPILSPIHRGQLMRMAIASAQMLSNACEAHIQAANDRHLESAERAGAGQ